MHTTPKTLVRLAMLALFALAPALGGCQTNPATGRLQFSTLSRAEEIQLGSEAMPALIDQYGGRTPSPVASDYVDRVGASLAQQTEADYPDLPWEFTLLDTEVVNAFALPGGKVFVSRGLVEKLDDEAELACVLGHEVGHVSAEHVDERLSRQMVVAGIVAGGAVAAGESDEDWVQATVPLVLGVAGQGYLLHFSRSQELEADGLGMRYASRAGYDPGGLVGVLEVLQAAGGPRAAPEFFSTHPYPERRIRQARSMIDTEYAGFTGSRYADRFRSDLLRTLEQLGPPAQSANPSATQTSLAPASSWCGVCVAMAEPEGERSAR